MYHVPHLIHVFFFSRYEKGLLSFVSERIKLVYRIKLVWKEINVWPSTLTLHET